MSHKAIYFFTLLFLFNSPTLHAQEFTYFNQEISLNSSNQLSVATIPHDEGYYTVGVFSFTHSVIYFANIDLEGNLISYNILDDSPNVTVIVSGRQFIKTKDENFVLIYQKRFDPIDKNTDIVIIKFTKNGEILWEQQFGGMGLDGTGGVIQTQDDGFLITGLLHDNNNNYIYTVKTDSKGVFEWEKNYCSHFDCNALSVDETVDGGYILGGRVRVANNNYDMYVVKIDSLGNQEWEKNYGSDINDQSCQVYALEDGNFLLSGGIRGENNIRQNYYAKLDKEGKILWEKSYGLPNLRSIQTPLVFREDGGFIGVAIYLNEHTLPLIMNFNAEGDTLWTKPITANPNADCYVKDIDRIEGGYVLTGYKFFPAPQHNWLVTIDEEGNFCEELGCVETVVDIEDVMIGGEEIFIQISPNPAHLQISIHYRLPTHSPTANLHLYDLQGALVREWRLKRIEQEQVLNLEGLASGVYFYQVGTQRGKLLIEHSR
ncbi:MAG: T9SS type A sorting domain-containing protein [Chitinophagales bacterium]